MKGSSAAVMSIDGTGGEILFTIGGGGCVCMVNRVQ